MRVLITGSTGYLGTLLTNFLISKEIPVTGIGLRMHSKHPEGKFFKYYSCDVADRDNLSSVFREEQPTHVIHLASNKEHNRKREYSVDIGGSKNILEICENTPSVRQLIYSSSAVAYGGHRTNPQWIGESFPLNPGKYRYGFNKSIAEEIFSSANVRKNLHIVTLRICQVTGPTGKNNRGFLNLLLKSPILPRICMNNTLQLLHESDFLSLMTRILHDDEIEGTYNMAPDTYTCIKDLASNKIYIPLPVFMLSGTIWFLWQMRLTNLQPESVNNVIYPIIIDPSKLVARYEYRFRYTTDDSFSDTMMNDKRFTKILQQMRREITVSSLFKKTNMNKL